MTLQSSGLIKLTQIQTELGGANPISLSEYYLGGLYTQANNTDVPTSGVISFSDLYNAERGFAFTISSSTQEANLNTLATAAGWDGSAILIANVASGVYLWSDNTANPGLLINVANCIVINSGYIIGRGGNGASYSGSGQAGGPAINVTSAGTTIQNNSGAYIAGGGGGGGSAKDTVDSDRAAGGGGAGGGVGGTGYSGSGSTPGAIGQLAADGTSYGTYQQPNSTPGTGGSHGGAGGGIGSGEGSGGPGSSSISGGRQPWGTTNSAYGSGIVRGGAGGFWGQAGSTGYGASLTAAGVGGAAIIGTSRTLVNNGTIYGSTS